MREVTARNFPVLGRAIFPWLIRSDLRRARRRECVMLQTKYLIVNADDFGQSTGINLSLMVRWLIR
jgi:hypothetical protein